MFSKVQNEFKTFLLRDKLLLSACVQGRGCQAGWPAHPEAVSLGQRH